MCVPSVAAPGMVWEGRADQEESSTWAETAVVQKGKELDTAPFRMGGQKNLAMLSS